ncbi:MAG: LysR family transcriptional regulator [Duodenibacillus sp.]|nr:LysR family transcriptional regulator [Duodenibacillus sp.]
MTDTAAPSLADPVELTRQLNSTVDRRLDILRRIDQTGSISEAARCANISYKAAWQAVETLANLAGTPLVEKVVGGPNGGGTQLTAAGKQVLELSRRLAQAREAVMRDFMMQQVPEIGWATSPTFRTSLRNQLPCTVTGLTRGPATVRLQMRIDEENQVRAKITQESQQLLDLKADMRVLAMFKATAVEIAAQCLPMRQSSVVTGTVIRSARAEKGGEVAIRLAGGLTVCGFAHPGHGLEPGDRAQARIPSAAVIIGLPD